jgi:hypothetical protein
MKWFGEPWPSASLRAAVCSDESLRVPPPPSGETCVLCGWEFSVGDRGVKMPHITAELWTVERYCHIECLAGNIGDLNQ